MKNIFVINGSASEPPSSNQRLIEFLKNESKDFFRFAPSLPLKSLPHFDPALSIQNPPAAVLAFREAVAAADGVLICSPEYVFSIPSGLKNALEWCVSTTVFSEKPACLITASASGIQGHEELQRIMRTLMAKFVPDTTLLLQGIKGQISAEGSFLNPEIPQRLHFLLQAFRALMNELNPAMELGQVL